VEKIDLPLWHLFSLTIGAEECPARRRGVADDMCTFVLNNPLNRGHRGRLGHGRVNPIVDNAKGSMG
jgi:hypothetical protein